MELVGAQLCRASLQNPSEIEFETSVLSQPMAVFRSSFLDVEELWALVSCLGQLRPHLHCRNLMPNSI